MAMGDMELFTAKYIHEQLKIPYKYLTSILRKLAEHGFLYALQGRYGGYKIANVLSEISLYDIVEAVEGSTVFQRCILGFAECSESSPCAMHEEWQPVKEAFIKALKNTTLATLSKRTCIRK